MKNDKMHVQYGCGLWAPPNWINFDASPSLRLQRKPLLGSLSKRMGLPVFPSNVRYGNIVKGLPVASASCEAVYCSHVLEHLAFEDAVVALRNSWEILETGGIFRIVVPDLEWEMKTYLNSTAEGASIQFMENTFLGYRSRPHGFNLVKHYFGNSRHLWMWDFKALAAQLKSAGFSSVRRARFGDSSLLCFKEVEDEGRWTNAVGIECLK
jgi:Methyltransferase domain